MSDPLIRHLRGMAGNNAWSNHRLHRACLALDPADFAARRTGFFPSLQETLNHILLVDRYYLAFLLGREGPDFSDPVPYPRMADLAVAQQAADRELIAFCDALDTAVLARKVTVRRDDSTDEEDPAALLAHLFVHQIHHRGQAHAMLSGTAVAPPQLDEYFLDYDAARRAPDLRAMGLPPPR
ncbi:MAG: DinB family protein [Sneathiellaceae bacterium]